MFDTATAARQRRGYTKDRRRVRRDGELGVGEAMFFTQGWGRTQYHLLERGDRVRGAALEAKGRTRHLLAPPALKPRQILVGRLHLGEKTDVDDDLGVVRVRHLSLKRATVRCNGEEECGACVLLATLCAKEV